MTRPRRITRFGRFVTVVSVLIFILAALMCYYFFNTVGFGGMGSLGMASMLAPPALLMIGLVSLMMMFWSYEKGWKVALVAFSGNVILCLYLSLSPSFALWKWAGDRNISLDLAEALLPQFNREGLFNRDGLSRTTTLAYDTLDDGTLLLLDAWPADMMKKRTPRPAIIKVHGGLLVGGSRRELTMWNSWFNKLGYHVFDVDYRKPGSGRSRDQVGDIKCALSWVKANAAEYNVDTTRLIVMGYSAGANLAMLAAYSHEHPELKPTCGEPVKVKCVINLYGASDMKAFYASSGSRSFVQPRMRQYIGGGPEEFDEQYDLLSPLSHISENSPPTISIYGEKDRIIPFQEGIATDNALKEANVYHELYILPQTDHAFDANWTYFSTQIARERILKFLHKYAE